MIVSVSVVYLIKKIASDHNAGGIVDTSNTDNMDG